MLATIFILPNVLLKNTTDVYSAYNDSNNKQALTKYDKPHYQVSRLKK